jgi:GNAT superfamily N-acetyltransferase
LATRSVVVRPVLDEADARAFNRLPEKLYARDPFWVAPLRNQEQQRWSLRHNPFLQTRWHRRFVAWRGRDPVGRVAAIRDDLFARRWSEGAGFFGFFESEDDPVTARSLLETAEASLDHIHCTHVFGPVNLSTHEEVGFLVQGYERRPMVLSPYNPPFYPGMAEAAGYSKALELQCYEWRRELTPRTEVARLRARSGEGLRIRSSDPGRWDEENRILFDLYNRCFANLWGFVPLTWPEYCRLSGSFRPFYRPELVLFAERDGRPIGFALTLPDVNEALAPLKGRLLPFGWWHLMRAIRKIRAGRFILIGVDPEETGHGVAFELSYRMMESAIRLGFDRTDLSLILDTNERMKKVITTYGWPLSSVYRLYRKDLVGAARHASP